MSHFSVSTKTAFNRIHLATSQLNYKSAPAAVRVCCAHSRGIDNENTHLPPLFTKITREDNTRCTETIPTDKTVVNTFVVCFYLIVLRYPQDNMRM